MSVNFNTIQYQSLTLPTIDSHCQDFTLVMPVPLEWIKDFSLTYYFSPAWGRETHHPRATKFAGIEVLENTTLEVGSLKGEADYSGEKSLATENLGLMTADASEARKWQHIKFKCTRQRPNIVIGVSQIKSIKYSILPSGDRPNPPVKPLPVSGQSNDVTTKQFSEQEIIDAWMVPMPIPDLTTVSVTPTPTNQTPTDNTEESE